MSSLRDWWRRVTEPEEDPAVALLRRVWESEAIHENGWKHLFDTVKGWYEKDKADAP